MTSSTARVAKWRAIRDRKRNMMLAQRRRRAHIRPELEGELTQETNDIVREKAFINVIQFRAEPDDVLIQKEMEKLRKVLKRDLEESARRMDPTEQTICGCCGRANMKQLFDQTVSREQCMLWIESILEGKVYRPVHVQGSVREVDVQFCKSCARELRALKIPKLSVLNGWPFLQEVLIELSRLSRHERLLISLRIPCIYWWRGKGGFGQHCTRGPPVSLSNPFATLAQKLPWRPTAVFSVLLDNGKTVQVRAKYIREALKSLTVHNCLYENISMDEGSFAEVLEIERRNMEIETSGISPSVEEIKEAEDREKDKGTQGPLDGESLFFLEKSCLTGVEDMSDIHQAKELMRHMLRPFSQRRRDMIPSHDATMYLEFYFPVLFPYGTGGPETLKVSTTLTFWCRYALSVYNSRFRKVLDFIFFANSVMRRRRLSGLSFHAPLRETVIQAIEEVRENLKGDVNSSVVTTRIENLIRSGRLSASFETLRGSPAFWASMKRKAWSYLVYFGPCQLFLTLSVADMIDPYVFMEIDNSMTYEEARKLDVRKRADLLARNPVAATTAFYRKVEVLLDCFLFGKTRPFGRVCAYLGRVEQQVRMSPHLHLLIWLETKSPDVNRNPEETGQAVSNFIEQF